MTTEHNTMTHAEEQAHAQMASISALVDALDCDFDRLEELKEYRVPRYVAGWNMPGYLPDNPPEEFEDIADARAYIAGELDRVLDEAGIPGTGGMSGAIRNGSGELGITVDQYHYFVTRDGFMWIGDEDEQTELEALGEKANGYAYQESVMQAIQEDPLSVEVRSDWYTPGEGDNSPSEFCILLCTGGPAVRIIGDLDHTGEPARPRLQYQDWGTPWIELINGVDRNALLTYCQQFYFGE